MAFINPIYYAAGILKPWDPSTDEFKALNITVNNTASGTIAGIIADNLLDKSAAESVGGAWTFTGIPTVNGVALTGAGGATITGFTSIEGIAAANLLDKSAVESVSGAWDFTTLDIPAGASLKIGGVAATANFTQVKFNELFDGGNATGHTHTGIDSFLSVTCGETVSQWDFVYIDSTTGKVRKADNEVLAKARIIGAMNEAGVLDDAKNMVAHQGEVLGPYTGLANATAGDPVYLDGGANAGKVTASAPDAGHYRVVVGVVKEADPTDGTFYYTGGETPLQV